METETSLRLVHVILAMDIREQKKRWHRKSGLELELEEDTTSDIIIVTFVQGLLRKSTVISQVHRTVCDLDLTDESTFA